VDGQWWAWWKGINLSWRVRDGELLTGDGSWDILKCPGQNGLLNVVITLKWWHGCMETPSENWKRVVADLKWVLENMVQRYGVLSSQVLDTSSSSLIRERPDDAPADNGPPSPTHEAPTATEALTPADAADPAPNPADPAPAPAHPAVDPASIVTGPIASQPNRVATAAPAGTPANAPPPPPPHPPSIGAGIGYRRRRRGRVAIGSGRGLRPACGVFFGAEYRIFLVLTSRAALPRMGRVHRQRQSTTVA
jgi:hypothetical protein